MIRFRYNHCQNGSDDLHDQVEDPLDCRTNDNPTSTDDTSKDRLTTAVEGSAGTMGTLRLALAAILLHTPLLGCQIKKYTQYNVNDMDDMDAIANTILAVLIGSVCEGSFLLLLLGDMTRRASQLYQQAKKKNSNAIQCFLSALGVFFLAASIIAFSAADYTYQTMSGGESPDMWIVANGIRNSLDVARQLAADSDNSGSSNLYEVSFFFSLAVLVYYGIGHAPVHCDINNVKPGNNNIPKKKAYQNRHVWFTGAAAVMAYSLGAWSPLMHYYLSFVGSFVFVAEGANSSIAKATVVNNLIGAKAASSTSSPNVIFLVPDSLSARYVATEEGRKMTPFLQSFLARDDTYHFPHIRSVSGNTVDALTALHTGCLPFTETGREMAFSRNIGTEFKRQGYQTATFSTAKVSLQTKAWQMLQNYLTGNIDSVFDPASEGHVLVNGEGSDDSWFMPPFEHWLQTQKEKPGAKQFVQFWQLDTHFPYRKSENSTVVASHPYYDGLASFDKTLETFFGILERNGQLNNTIVVVSGDHGDQIDHEKGSPYVRLSSYSPNILNPLAFLHIPKALFPSEQARETLKRNQDKVLSTLDIFPTMQHILYGGDVDATVEQRKTASAVDLVKDQDHCVTGLDLLGTQVPEDRLAISWNCVSVLPKMDGRRIAVSDKRSGVFRRWDKGVYRMDYTSDCVENNERSTCTVQLRRTGSAPAHKARWRSILEDLRKTNNTRGLSKQLIENTEVLDYLLEGLQ